MKKIVYIFLFFTFLNCNTFTQENNIWGIWNTGSRDDVRIGTYEDGAFLMTRGQVLVFQSDYFGRGPRISEQGYHYRIIEVIRNEGNIVSLYIETNLANFQGHPIANAKFNMHFLDRDRMWMEIDHSDEQYPTDPRFGITHWFANPSVIFWRERVSLLINTRYVEINRLEN